jgi:Neuraminidase (sialidase)
MSRREITGLIVFAFIFAAAAMGQQKPDFSGEWIFNPQKSKLEIKINLEKASFTIDHQEPNFHFSRVFVVDGKQDAFSYSMTTDGREVVTKQADRTTYSRLYWDGDVLVFDTRIVLNSGREATNVVRYGLKDGGKTFVAAEKFRGPALKYDNLWVADKKPG